MGRRGDNPAECFSQVYDLENGIRVRFQAAVCGKCGFTHMVRDAGNVHRRPPSAIAKVLRAAGWSVGSRRAGDHCPKCVQASRRSPRGRQPEPVISVLEEETMSDANAADEPRQPTREDRRKIRDELDAHYDEAAARYRKDWTDQAVAEKLKVPRAWVSALREDFCGPDTNEAAQAQALLMANTEGRLLQGIDRGYAVIAELEGLLAEVRKAMAQ